MSYTAHITDKETGEMKTRVFEHDWEGVDDYLWGDGNFGCDCNRGRFFHGPGVDSPCGDNRYHVTIEVNGREVYADG